MRGELDMPTPDVLGRVGTYSRILAIEQALETAGIHISSLDERPPFLTTKVGYLKTMLKITDALLAVDGIEKGYTWVNEVINAPEFARRQTTTEEEVEFVEAEVRELGEATGRDFNQGCVISRINETAPLLGWAACEPSDAIYALLAGGSDNAAIRYFSMTQNGVFVRPEESYTFCITKNGQLKARLARYHDVFSPKSRIVFRRAHKSQTRSKK